MFNTSLTINHKQNFLAYIALALIYFFTVSESLADTKKVEIRIAAAQAAFKQNYQDNQPFDSRTMSGAYDVLWQGELVNGSFRASKMKVLHGSGSTQVNYKIGPGTCTGTLSATAGRNFSPLSSADSKGKVTMSFEMPSLAANNGQEAFIMDKNQPQFSACKFVATELESATCFNPTRECFTITGSITPVVALPNEDTPFAKFLNRKDRAYVQFNEANPNASIPFTYSSYDTVVDHLGKTVNIYKNVYAGFFKITTNVGNIDTTPVNPGGFIPPGLTDPPPPANPFTGGGGDIVGPVITAWTKAFGPVVRDFSKTVQSLNSVGAKSTKMIARAATVPMAGTTFDPANGQSSISTEIIGATPATGKLQVKFKALTPANARGFKLTIPTKGAGTAIVKDQATLVPFKMDRESLNLIKSGKAAKVFFTVRVTPTGSKKVFEKAFSFDLKAIKKK